MARVKRKCHDEVVSIADSRGNAMFECAICYAVTSLVIVGLFGLPVLLRDRGDARSGR